MTVLSWNGSSHEYVQIYLWTALTIFLGIIYSWLLHMGMISIEVVQWLTWLLSPPQHNAGAGTHLHYGSEPSYSPPQTGLYIISSTAPTHNTIATLPGPAQLQINRWSRVFWCYRILLSQIYCGKYWRGEELCDQASHSLHARAGSRKYFGNSQTFLGMLRGLSKSSIKQIIRKSIKILPI